MSHWFSGLRSRSSYRSRRRPAYAHFRRLELERLESRRLLAASTYTWQNAAIGAGGFVDGIFYDPHNQNVIYARTDIGGLYKTTNDGQTWTQLLDFVGNNTSTSGNGTQQQLIGVLSFAMDPENSNDLYALVGEYTGTNGAVFYSTNGGQTWSQTNLSFYVGGNSNGRATGERIAVDPYDSNIVLLGTNANGLWESADAGHSFSQVSGFSTSASVNFVLFNPYGGTAGSATQNIFVGLNSTAGLSPQTTAPEPSNIWQTTNGGTSWSQIVGTGSTPGRNIAALSVSSLSRSGSTATAQTAAANGFLVGDQVTIAGASPTSFDGTFTITGITNSTTFTYSLSGSSSSTATGTITAAINGSWMPNRAVLASDGNLYVSYSNGLAPNSSLSNGGVFRYNTSTGVWANISPDLPQVTNGTADQFGYVGLALDPENSTTVVVTSFDRYAFGDAIWRTTNANAATPTWTALFQFQGYGGNNTTRNTSNAPWVAAFDDGIGNWAGDVAINPYNSAQIMYGTGQGIWATNNGTSSTTLTAANSWYFPDNGIEFTAVLKLIAPQTGVPLFSALGDINGFVHSTLTSSPSGGGIAGQITNGGLGTMNSIDFAQNNPNFEAIVGTVGSHDGAYTTNDGTTWTEFAARPANNATGGTEAVSADGTSILWAASGKTPFYSTNDGSTWTASTMPSGTLTGGTVISDRVNSSTFYYWTENSSDNQWKLYISTDGGHTFTQTGSTLSNGNITLVANPSTAGDLWFSSYNGVYHSTNSGASFTQLSSIGFANVPSMALGAAPPGKTYPAIYIYGTIGSFLGVYRSDDGGTTWTLLNDVNNQWGGLVDTMAADPNVFGRVYLGINGRGVIVGNPTSSLPTGWTDADINLPGNPGWSTSSEMLSNGSTVNEWIVNGGGAGISGASDQFNFAYSTVSGGASISAQLLSMTNADGGTGTPQAGVIFRAGANNGDVYAALMQTTGNQLLFQYRTTNGGSVSTTSLGSVPVGAEYIELIRSGNNFSAYYSADDITWTQLGSTVAIAAMPATADVGLAATANFNSQLTSATFANVVIRLQGDINLDGHVNAADIVAMMQAFTDLNSYQTTNNLSPQDVTLVADVNGDGIVNNADLQYLLSRLISGGGSTSQDENAPAGSAVASAPIVPTLIFSTGIVTAPAAAPPQTITSSDSPSTSAPATDNVAPAESRQFIPVETTSEITLPDSTSTFSPTDGNHSTASSAAAQDHSSLATIDRYFARLDQPTLLHAKSHRSSGSHHQATDESLADSWMEPLIDFARWK